MSRSRADIHAHIATRMAGLRVQYADYGYWIDDVLDRITQYCLNGKMIRGMLALLAYEGYCNGSGTVFGASGASAAGDAAASSDSVPTAGGSVPTAGGSVPTAGGSVPTAGASGAAAGTTDAGGASAGNSIDTNGTHTPLHILDISAAMELLQSFLLIHDDIMDKDSTRRGAPSIHEQYRRHISTQHTGAISQSVDGGTQSVDGSAQPADDSTQPAGDALHYGNSMAICVGDIVFAIANTLIDSALHHNTRISADIKFRIKMQYSSEIIRVGIAQMDDVHFSHSTTEPTAQEIVSLYRNKTGYYSIVLPLTLGALFAGQQHELPLLQKIGLSLGEVFQIRDDLLGVTADAPATKSIQSDIINKKKTYIRQLLIAQDNPAHIQRLHDIESRAIPKTELLPAYRSLLSESGILRIVTDIISERTEKNIAAIDGMQKCSTDGKELLRQFCIYNSQRTK